MPRMVRNFFVTAQVDGRKSDIRTGPRSGGGGIDITVYVRSDGSVSEDELRITGDVTRDGLLQLRVRFKDDVILEHITKR